MKGKAFLEGRKKKKCVVILLICAAVMLFLVIFFRERPVIGPGDPDAMRVFLVYTNAEVQGAQSEGGNCLVHLEEGSYDTGRILEALSKGRMRKSLYNIALYGFNSPVFSEGAIAYRISVYDGTDSKIVYLGAVNRVFVSGEKVDYQIENPEEIVGLLKEEIETDFDFSGVFDG